MADGRLLFDTKINTSGFTKGLKGLGSLAGKAVAGVTKAVIGVTAGIAAFGVAAVKTGMEFEAQMSRVQAISGATGEELKELNKLAVKLGADTAFSAKEAADGMENLASAGFDTKEIMSAMPGLLDLAAVSGGDVAKASEVAASTLRAFGLEASKAGHIADVFARAAADTNAEVDDMGEAMKYVAPVAKAMGQTVEETAAAIGLMSDAGIKGSQAGTTLRGAFSRLVKPTKKMNAVMDELGLKFFDAQGNMKPLNGIISELQRGTKGLTQEQKNQAIVTLFGQESLSGMLALVEAGPDKLNELTKSLKNSDGAADEMARTMQNNVQSGIEQMLGSLETLQIKIFQSVDKPLGNAIGKITDYINKMGDAFSGLDEATIKKLNNSSKGLEELGISAAQAKGGVEGLVMVLGGMLTEALIGLAKSLPNVAQLAVNVVSTFAQSLTNNLPQISKSAADLGIILINGLLKIVPQILVAGIEIVSSFIGAIADKLPSLIPTFITGLQNVINTIITNLPKFVSAAGKIIDSLVQGILKSLPILIPAIIQIVDSFGQVILENLPILLDAALQIILALSDGIVTALPTLIPQVVQIILTIVEFITENINLVVDAAVKIILGLVQGLIQALPQIIPAALKMIVAICDALIENIPVLIDAALELIMALAQGLIDNLPYLIEQVPRIINSFADALFGKIPQIIATGFKLLVALGKGLINAIPTLIANIPQIIMAIINAFTLMNFLSLGKNLISHIGKGITYMKNNIGGIVKNLANNVIDFIKNIFTKGLSIGKDLISSIGRGIHSMFSFIGGVARNLGNTAIDAIKSAFTGAFDIGKNLIQGLWNGIKSVTGWIKDKIAGFAGGILSSIKGFFGIKSPSRVMAKEVGKWLPPGVAVGFDDSMPKLEKNVKKQLGGLTDTMQKTVEAESTLTAGKIAANSNVYLPSPYDRKEIKSGSTAMIIGDIHTTVDLEGRTVGYSTARYSSEEQALDSKRRRY
ncbi:phage tail tape measure protein, TP901 family, core region [Helcococcus kunzii ATCC 51366]|uniref:Phage tail tape measure protein, TP901 family, core region n=1 Tax=Helcococcus kunzii ATCC 51366 TaxID=883114 RepID=H3NPC3_9FIRM|nr:phage tail tape measure protein [Helcococcus kunzii]EHR33436.1 phage tail tape measure protein, TP901 family, core region [Helcococcus kunzii ATCC 51366]